MIRGTTPTAKFNISGIDVSILKDIYITFKQGSVELTKKLDDVIIDYDNNSISVRLTQEETLMFHENNVVHVQIRAKTESGDALASDIITEKIERILMDGVI